MLAGYRLRNDFMRQSQASGRVGEPDDRILRRTVGENESPEPRIVSPMKEAILEGFETPTQSPGNVGIGRVPAVEV
ncbi:hypothetical protein C7402_112255 [Paraburkholderia unamae]|uniref:Uncharacterized protein n=1 Tax=Paraburkholderia unamae TaxID=219649 RepID=A0ABX5KLT4_9BURK|nr:hypothetical protein C7402_112255 [Paraburkholderia unamae]